MATTDPVLVQSYRKQVDELEERLAEVEAERDEAREQVIAADVVIFDLSEALEWALDRLDTLTRNDAMDAETYKRYAEARALLREGAEDAD